VIEAADSNINYEIVYKLQLSNYGHYNSIPTFCLTPKLGSICFVQTHATTETKKESKNE
jgi:hypothetical protein